MERAPRENAHFYSRPKKFKENGHWLDLDVGGTGPLRKHSILLSATHNINENAHWIDLDVDGTAPRENTLLFKSRLSTTFPGYLCRMVGHRVPITTNVKSSSIWSNHLSVRD